MPVKSTFRSFFFPIAILISILLSATSLLPSKKDTAPLMPILQEDVTDINPTYEWGRFIGTAYYDEPKDLIIDNIGNIFVLSDALDSGSPDSTNPASDPSKVMISKITSAGDLEWEMTLDTGVYSISDAISLDNLGNIYVTGSSANSWGDPLTALSAGRDIFIAKFDPNGSLLWNTFVGVVSGQSPDSMAVDIDGNVYIVGDGIRYDLSGGADTYAFFLVKLTPTGVLEWSQAFEQNGFTKDHQIKISPDGNIFLAGYADRTWGQPLKGFTGTGDMYVSMFDETGILLWNTFLGINVISPDDNWLTDFEISKNGNIYLSGYTDNSWGNPIIPMNGTQGGFLASMDANGNLLWNTFVDGENTFISHITFVGDDGPFLLGESESTWGNPLTSFNDEYNGNTFIAQFDSTGTLKQNSFIGRRSNILALANKDDGFYFLRNGFYQTSDPIKILDSGIDEYDFYIMKLNLYGTVFTYRPPSPYVPDITLHIPTPLDISTDPKVIGTNIFLAVFLMLPFAIAVDVFSRIFSENEDTLNRFTPISWIGKLQKRLHNIATSSTSKQGLRDILGILGVVAFYGLVFSLLDKTWKPFSKSGIVLFVSMSFAFGLVGLLDDIFQWRTIRKWGYQGEFTVRPTNIFLAGISTAVSRLLALAPGLMFGSPEALKINEDELSPSQNQSLAKISTFTYVFIGLVAWLPTIATELLQKQNITENQKNLFGGIEAFLLVIFAVALENVFVQLIGISEGLGQKIKSWNKWVWGISVTLAAFAFLHTLLNPHYDFVSALKQGNVLVFILVSVSFISMTFILNLHLRNKNTKKQK